MLVETTTQGTLDALTIRELFEWAQDNGCEDAVIRYYDGDSWAVLTEIEGEVYPAYMDAPAVSVNGVQI